MSVNGEERGIAVVHAQKRFMIACNYWSSGPRINEVLLDYFCLVSKIQQSKWKVELTSTRRTATSSEWQREKELSFDKWMERFSLLQILSILGVNKKSLIRNISWTKIRNQNSNEIIRLQQVYRGSTQVTGRPRTSTGLRRGRSLRKALVAKIHFWLNLPGCFINNKHHLARTKSISRQAQTYLTIVHKTGLF